MSPTIALSSVISSQFCLLANNEYRIFLATRVLPQTVHYVFFYCFSALTIVRVYLLHHEIEFNRNNTRTQGFPHRDLILSFAEFKVKFHSLAVNYIATFARVIRHPLLLFSFHFGECQDPFVKPRVNRWVKTARRRITKKRPPRLRFLLRPPLSILTKKRLPNVPFVSSVRSPNILLRSPSSHLSRYELNFFYIKTLYTRSTTIHLLS